LYSGSETPSSIELPAVPLQPESVPRFSEPEHSDSLPNVTSTGNSWPETWTLQRNQQNRSTTATWSGRDQTTFPWGIMKNFEEVTYFVQDHLTDTSSVQGYSETAIQLPHRSLKWAAHLDFKGDLSKFYFQYKRQLFENGALIRERIWDEVIPRDHQ
jgi:hypothetical protein